MRNIPVDQTINNSWAERKSGGGVVTVANNVLTVTGGGSDRAMKDFYFEVRPGTVIEVEVFARALSGEARVGIDTGLDNNAEAYGLLGYGRTTRAEWSKVYLKVVVPYGSNVSKARLVLGRHGSQWDSTNAEYKRPQIRVTNDNGSLTTLACGMIHVNNGVPTLRKDYKNFGVKSVSFTDAMTLKVETESTFSANGNHPLVFCNCSPDNVLIAQAGQFTTNYFNVKFSNGVAFQDMTTKTAYVFFELKS